MGYAQKCNFIWGYNKRKQQKNRCPKRLSRSVNVSLRRSSIDENDSVSRRRIIFHLGIVAKLNSAAEFYAAEDLAIIYSKIR